MRAFSPRLDALPLAQRQLWPSLAPAAAFGLVIYGVTALAIRLAHRPSLDFDFFDDRPLDRVALMRLILLAQAAPVL